MDDLMRGVRLLLTGAALFLALALPAFAPAAAPTDPQGPTAADSPLKIMRVAEALDRIGRPLQDVVVAIPDTGLDLDHPDLQPRLFALGQPTPVPDPDGGPNHVVAAGAAGWDFIGTNAPSALAPDADPSDFGAHGTAVAGVLGAAWDNGQGGAGVAPNARIMALRTCWPNDECYQYVQAAAVNWAAARGARVVSMSWLSGPLEPGFQASITGNPNTLFVTIPSGNGGATDADPDAANRMPCSLNSPNVLCVSTSSPSDGLDCGDYGASTVDVAVPTQGGLTTADGGGFQATTCATSYAAPTAAGVATILFGLDPSATPAEVKSAIIDSARRVPAWSGRSVSGGIVDAEAAVVLFAQRRNISLAVPAPAPSPAPPGISAPAPTPVPVPVRAPILPAPSLKAPGISRVGVSVTRGRRPAIRVSARIASNGSTTTWAIQRRVVRRTKTGRRIVVFVSLRAGRLSPGAAGTTVSATLRLTGAITVRVLARNRAGTSVSRLFSASTSSRSKI
jgi:Subtilase family